MRREDACARAKSTTATSADGRSDGAWSSTRRGEAHVSRLRSELARSMSEGSRRVRSRFTLPARRDGPTRVGQNVIVTDDTTLDRVYVRARRHLPALSTSPVACRHSCIPNDCHPRCVLSPRPSPGAILDVATQTLTKKGVAALGCSKGIGAPCSEQLAVTRSTLLSRMLCAHAFPAVDDWRGTWCTRYAYSSVYNASRFTTSRGTLRSSCAGTLPSTTSSCRHRYRRTR